MSPGGSRGARGKKNYVLPLAIVLVVGQIAAFVAIKLTKDKPAKPAADETIAQRPPVQGSGGLVPDVTAAPSADHPPPTDQPPATVPAPSTAPPPAPDPAAATTDPTTTADGAGVAADNPSMDTDEPVVPIDPKQAKRDAAKAKAAKDKAEKLAKEKAEKAAKAEKERKDAEDRKREADAKRVSDAEKARLAAEAEKARLAAEKAKAEADAEQARLEAEKLKAAAAAEQAAAATAAAKAGSGSGDHPKGSSSVLVLVFGPGVSGASREAIRNVYLGKTSVWPNGTTAHPMNRPAGSAAGRKFFGGILGMSGGEYREHWSELQLSGGGIAPSTVSSATTMLAKVAATHGGMGYVLESELPENTNGVTLVRLK